MDVQAKIRVAALAIVVAAGGALARPAAAAEFDLPCNSSGIERLSVAAEEYCADLGFSSFSVTFKCAGGEIIETTTTCL